MMKTNHVLKIAFTFGILLAIFLSGCGLLSTGKPTATIIAPPSGTQVDVNTEVQFQINSSDDEGIVRIELVVNGEVVATELSPQASGQPVFIAVLRWTPKSPGNQVVEARSYNRKGVVSGPASVNLQIREVVANATLTPVSVQPGIANPTPTLTSAPGVPTSPPPPPVTVVVVLPTAELPPQQQPTVPAAPAAPSAFNANGTGTTIAFTWNDNSLNETGFRIYQVGTVAPVIALGSHAATGGMASNWTSRPCNVSATFFIRAYNDAGESASSNTNGAVTIPCAPTGLNAVGASQSAVNVSFTDNATNETDFRVYRVGTAAPVEILSAHLGTGAKSGSVTPVICGQTYDYFVRAFNAAGESASSNTNLAATLACTVKVTFTSIHIYDDTDSTGPGDVWCTLGANASSSRYPNSGTISVNSGETKPISGESFTLALLRTQNLTVSATCKDEDTFPSADDPMGTATQIYSGTFTWSEGDRCDESTSPHDFKICYKIEVTP